MNLDSVYCVTVMNVVIQLKLYLQLTCYVTCAELKVDTNNFHMIVVIL
jgi:hypothetical protein